MRSIETQIKLVQQYLDLPVNPPQRTIDDLKHEIDKTTKMNDSQHAEFVDFVKKIPELETNYNALILIFNFHNAFVEFGQPIQSLPNFLSLAIDQIDRVIVNSINPSEREDKLMPGTLAMQGYLAGLQYIASHPPLDFGNGATDKWGTSG